MKCYCRFLSIDKISSLSCQEVADSITSSKMGNNVAKQASVLLRYTYTRLHSSLSVSILHDIISGE